MLTKVVWGCKFKQVCVKRWHFRLDIVKQVGLLHVTAVDLDWHLFEELCEHKFVLDYVLLKYLHLENAMVSAEG